MQERIANDASNVVTAHGMRGQLCAVVWIEDGHCRTLAPKGHDEAVALMLYRAVDAFAERAGQALSKRSAGS